MVGVGSGVNLASNVRSEPDARAGERVGRGEQPQQFLLIQALRGLAALWVVLYHVSEGQHAPALEAWLPTWVDGLLFRAGDMGVAVFFALSGFVIAHSLRHDAIDARYVGRFALRRSIRLDPPYWAAMALVVVLGAVAARMKGLPPAVPPATDVVAHVFYLQTLLVIPQINAVFWTLTFEVQFYLALVLLVMLGQRLGVSRVTVALLPLVPAALTWAGLLPDAEGLFYMLWHCFLAGVLAYWGMTDHRARAAMGVVLPLVVVAVVVAQRSVPFTLVSVATAVGLWLASRTELLRRGLSGRGFQALGTISYSLYLTHGPVTGAVFFASKKLGLPELVGVAATLAASVAVAALFWRVLERPSQALAQRISLRRPALVSVPRAP